MSEQITTLLKDAARLLEDKYRSVLKADEGIRLEVQSQEGKLKLRALVGTEKRAHEFELWTPLGGRDEADLALLLLDFFDAAADEFFRHNRRAGFGLDFAKRQFEKTELWVRQEYRDFEAERLADALLLSADSKKRSKID